MSSSATPDAFFAYLSTLLTISITISATIYLHGVPVFSGSLLRCPRAAKGLLVFDARVLHKPFLFASTSQHFWYPALCI